MLNPPERPLRQLNNLPYVVGGNSTARLKRWLNSIGVIDYYHLALNVESIAPEEIWKSAEYLARTLSHVPMIFSVGTFAHKVLDKASLKHGALPSTKVRDQKQINKALDECRNYLLGRYR